MRQFTKILEMVELITKRERELAQEIVCETTHDLARQDPKFFATFEFIGIQQCPGVDYNLALANCPDCGSTISHKVTKGAK